MLGELCGIACFRALDGCFDRDFDFAGYTERFLSALSGCAAISVFSCDAPDYGINFRHSTPSFPFLVSYSCGSFGPTVLRATHYLIISYVQINWNKKETARKQPESSLARMPREGAAIGVMAGASFFLTPRGCLPRELAS